MPYGGSVSSGLCLDRSYSVVGHGLTVNESTLSIK